MTAAAGQNQLMKFPEVITVRGKHNHFLTNGILQMAGIGYTGQANIGWKHDVVLDLP